MREVIDIHTHFINFDYMPDEYTIHLLKNNIGILAKPLKEEYFRNQSCLIKALIGLLDGLGIEYLKEFINALNKVDFVNNPDVIDTLINEGEYLLPSDIKDEYRQGRLGKLILCVPLMMDFIKASNYSTPTSAPGVIPYTQQTREHSFLAARYPWRILPFFHFHPERHDALLRCKKAIKEMGFIGIKIYPAMGFYPEWEDNENEIVKNNLRELYEYIQRKEEGYLIPVTTHAQNGSTQAIDLKTYQTREFTRISNWKNVIKKYGLKINFGHYGGTDFLDNGLFDMNKREFSEECRENIRSLMTRYNKNGVKLIFTDTSAHTDRKRPYFRELNADLDKESHLIMFGTDLPVTTPFTLNKDYINAYEENIDSDKKKERFFKTHALDFLFEGGKVPPNYIEFLKTNYQAGKVEVDPFSDKGMPDYVKKHLTIE